MPVGSAIIARTRSRIETAYDEQTAALQTASDREVREEWARWLSTYPWTHFITVTFREPRTLHSAESTINQLHKRIRRLCPRGRLFLGTELHLSRALHVHGLLDAFYWADGAALAHILWKDLYTDFGRTTVSPVQSSEAVSNYVSKYVTKEFTSYVMD